MHIFFEIMKWFFFFFTIIIGLLFLRGEIILGTEYFMLAKQIIMPGYLVFCGIIMWYIIAYIQSNQETGPVYVRSFIIGITLWVILAIIYMFL